MIGITGTVVGGAQVELRMLTASERVRLRLREDVQRLGIQLQGKVRTDYLTGQSLRVRTGRLRTSINERTTETATSITSSVGTKVPYGRAWELGFFGVVAVKAHVRKVKARSTFGRWEDKKRTKTSQGVGFVRPYSRRVSMKARPFLRPALEMMRPTIVATLRKSMGVI